MTRMRKKTVAYFLLGLILTAPFGAAYGAQDTAQVAGYTGNMILGADGSLAVEEYVTWRVSGSPLLTRRLDVSNATAVEDINVYRVIDPDPAQPEDAQRTALWRADTADADTYDYTVTGDGSGRYLTFDLYPVTEERYLTLVFSYRLTDCAYLYQDGAAFYFNPLWQAGEGSLESFFMHCRLGEDIERGEGNPRYYANGGITEEWTGPDLYSSQVDLSTGLEVVAVLPVSWVPQGRKAVKNNILPHLDAQQEIFVAQREQLLAQQQDVLARSRLILWVAVAVMAGGVLLIFLLYGLRPSRRSQRKKYLPPSRHLPGEARLLLRRSLTRRTALAELIYLWHSGFVKLVRGEGGRWTLKPEKRSDEVLSLHDQYLLSFLVHHSGGADDNIRDKLSDPTAFNIWKGLVKKTVARKRILKEAKAAWVIGLGLGVMEWVLAVMIVVNINAWDTAVVVAAMGVLVAGYGCVVRKVSPEEVREIVRYRTYARQLRKEKGCAGPWKRQLAYAMALGADRPLLRALVKEGKGEVRDFAAWVRRERRRMSLPVWILSSAGDGRNRMKPVKPGSAARHEAAATRITEHKKHAEARYQKPDQAGKPRPQKPVNTVRHETADMRIEEYGRRTEARYRKPDQAGKPKPLKPISTARHENAAAQTAKRRKHTHNRYRKPDPKQWPPGGLGKR